LPEEGACAGSDLESLAIDGDDGELSKPACVGVDKNHGRGRARRDGLTANYIYGFQDGCDVLLAKGIMVGVDGVGQPYRNSCAGAQSDFCRRSGLRDEKSARNAKSKGK
jgi:hypothetical protein